MAEDHIISLRSRPWHRRPVDPPMDCQNSVRSYRFSSEDICLQIRRTNDFISAFLTFEQAKELAANLLKACPKKEIGS